MFTLIEITIMKISVPIDLLSRLWLEVISPTACNVFEWLKRHTKRDV